MALRARHFGVLLLTLSTGCVTVGSPWSFPKSFLRKDADQTTEKHDEWTKDTKKDEEEESAPLIAALTEGQKSKPEETLLSDAQTKELIESELADATPEEREELLTFIQTLQPSQIPQVLRARRIAKNQKAELLAESQSDVDAPAKQILPAAHSLAPDSETGVTPIPESEAVQSRTGNSKVSSSKRTASADASTSPGWQKKFKSLAEPGWRWPHPNGPESESPATSSEKTDRNAFGFSQLLAPHSNQAAPNGPVAAVSTSQEPKSVPPSSAETPSEVKTILESRITPGSALWEDEMLKLISLLEAESSSSLEQDATAARESIRKQVALRMLYLVTNEPQKALQAIPGLPPEEQEFWTAIFLGLSEKLDQNGTSDPAERATQTIAQLHSAAYHLQQTAKLRMRNVTFCQQINGFGNYEQFKSNQFSPGQTVLIYAEIRNFRSEPVEDGHFVTRIKSTIEIYTGGPEQELIDRNSFDATEDRSRTLRTDYYHSYRVDLPSHLASGPHIIKLILQDELTGKQTTESIHFTIK